MKKGLKFIMPILFFLLGSLIGYAWKNHQKEAQAGGTSQTTTSVSQTSYSRRTRVVVPPPVVQTTTSTQKYTIAETKAISTDKTIAQTGEDVNFSVTLKNTGTKGKGLTHICFNHSGGVTFGCLHGPQGPTFDPGQEKSFGAGTRFKTPGTYSVWVSWSQDWTNFYRPNNGATVAVTIE